MVIEELGAQAFRNYRELFVRFSPRVNILLGENGQGKTNLAEGIYYVAALDSFRTHAFTQLIQQGQPHALLQAAVSAQDTAQKARIEISRSGRRVWLNQAPVQRLSSYVSAFFALVFNPDSLYLYRNFPAERRLFFNRFLAFLDHGYLVSLQEFKVVHAQKNKLLKSGEISSLPAWNQLFVERNHAMLNKRLKAAEEVNALLAGMFAALTGRRERLRLVYRPSLQGEPAEALRTLEQAREQEAERGHAVLGAHRDDFRMVLDSPSAPAANGEPVPQASPGEGRREPLFSQGEYRVALLALLLAVSQLVEARLVRARGGFRPVLILDDVFSELDGGVQARLAAHLQGLANQIFITTTRSVDPLHVPDARIMEIREGRVVTELA